MRISRPRIIGGLVLALIAWELSACGQDPLKPKTRAHFMRQKLDLSKQLLEGLVKEDYPQISENARKLKALSKAAEWNVGEIPNVDEYLLFTTDFRRVTDDLMKKAKDRNIDGATLAFSRLTMNCVECHRFIRGEAN